VTGVDLRLLHVSEGQGLVEYALILVLVALVVLVVLAIFGPAVGNVFSNIVAGV
jgi:pilus assembly protein Flp/PilA